jgi:hypothetical protein
MSSPASTMLDDVVEQFSFARDLSDLERAYLGKMGLEEDDVALDWRGDPAPIKAGSVYFHTGSPSFEFEAFRPGGEAVPALLFVALESNGDPVDIIGWNPRLGRLGAWLGHGPILGGENLLSPRMGERGALRIHRDPIGWLKARRAGIVLVNHRGAAMRLQYRGPYEGEDAQHAAELRKLLTLAPPRIIVPDAPALQVAA